MRLKSDRHSESVVRYRHAMTEYEYQQRRARIKWYWRCAAVMIGGAMLACAYALFVQWLRH